MKPETEALLEQAKKAPKSTQIKMALITELSLAYQLGMRNVPRERVADYIAQVAHLYFSLITSVSLQEVMQAAMDEDASADLAVLAFEMQSAAEVEKHKDILNNLRQALITDFLKKD